MNEDTFFYLLFFNSIYGNGSTNNEAVFFLYKTR